MLEKEYKVFIVKRFSKVFKLKKFHVSLKTGETGPCKANIRNCPVGSPEQHFNTESDARTYYETTMKTEQFSTLKSNLKKKLNKLNKSFAKKAVAAGGVAVFSMSAVGCGSSISIGDPDSLPVNGDHTAAAAPVTQSGEQTPRQKKVAAAIKKLEKKQEDAKKAYNEAKKEFDKAAQDGNLPKLPPPPNFKNKTDGSSSSVPNDAETKQLIMQAKQEIDGIPVKGRAPMTGYSRDAFVKASSWDKARQEVLSRDLTNINRRSTDGKVVSGTLNDPYTGNNIQYEIGGRSEIDVDHVVALGNAWVSGAQYKSSNIREQIATDPDNLLAVDAGANRQKGDGDAATWLPSNKKYRCSYVSRQTIVKTKFSLSMTQAEKTAIKNILDNC